MILVREPDAGDPHVRFDERRLETELQSYRASRRLYSLSARSAVDFCCKNTT